MGKNEWQNMNFCFEQHLGRSDRQSRVFHDIIYTFAAPSFCRCSRRMSYSTKLLECGKIRLQPSEDTAGSFVMDPLK